jgi:hypothetical protein
MKIVLSLLVFLPSLAMAADNLFDCLSLGQPDARGARVVTNTCPNKLNVGYYDEGGGACAMVSGQDFPCRLVVDASGNVTINEPIHTRLVAGVCADPQMPHLQGSQYLCQ